MTKQTPKHNSTKAIQSASSNDFAEIYGGVAKEMIVSTGYPRMQMINPKDVNLPHGLFIPLDQAEAAEFKPTDRWKKTEYCFGTSDQATEGYISTNPRLLIILASVPEVYIRRDKNVEFVGYRFDSNGRGQTAWGDLIGSDPNALYGTVFLTLPLDDNNKPISEQPIIYRSKGAFSVQMSIKFKMLCSAVSQCLKEITGNKKNMNLNDKQKSHVVFNFDIVPRKIKLGNNQTSIQCFVSGYDVPSINPDEWETTVKVNGQRDEMSLNVVDLTNVFLPPNHETVTIADDMFESYYNDIHRINPDKEPLKVDQSNDSISEGDESNQSAGQRLMALYNMNQENQSQTPDDQPIKTSDNQTDLTGVPF